MIIILWIIVGLIAIFFLFSGTVKVFGRPEPMFEYQLKNYFEKYGYGRQFMRFVGLGELFGAFTIWVWQAHWLAMIGLAGLVFITASALYHHLRYDSFKEGIPALVMLVLSSIILISSALTFF